VAESEKRASLLRHRIDDGQYFFVADPFERMKKAN
jgi:hypothetical protein